MKNKCLKRAACILLVGMFTVSLCSCGEEVIEVQPMEEQEVHVVGMDFLGGQDVMPISGFYGPTTRGYSIDAQSQPDYFTDEIFSLVAECGINMFGYTACDYQYYPEQVKKMLELGEKHSIGITINDSLINVPNADKPLTTDELAAEIAKYSDYPAFVGVHVVDEPGSPYFHNQTNNISMYAPVFTQLRELGIWAYGNLHPLWFDKDYDNYCKMLEEYCETCAPTYLCFDHYVWDPNRPKLSFFQNMDVIRHYAENYEIPFWLFVQAGGQWNDAKNFFDSEEYYPTEGQLHWNVNVGLAYGAKGIQYFPVIQPSYFAYALTERMDFQRNGLIGAWGNKTQWWYYAKNINRQVAAVDEVLMNSVNVGVIVTGKNAIEETKNLEFIMKETTWRELKSIEGNTMTGCFNYQGKSVLYVVNYEADYAQKITLNLHDSYNMSVTKDAKTERISTNKLELDMQPGEGVLIAFE